jgi:arsenate reductase
MGKKRVLVLCTGNSARSQIAEGLLRHEADKRFEVYSAGTQPTQVRSEAVEVMRELGIDISGHRSKPLAEFAGREFEFVITVCNRAREECPVFSGAPERLHWPFEDPATFVQDGEERLRAFRSLRDRIHARVMVFLGEGAYGSREAD